MAYGWDERSKWQVANEALMKAIDPARITGLAAEWNQAGVETWVMGLPGSDTTLALLDAIAKAGGTGKVCAVGTTVRRGAIEVSEPTSF